MNKSIQSSLTHILVAAIFSILPLHQSYAAPGALPARPLFLSNLIDPNLYYTLDDSGSMGFSITAKSGPNGMGADNDTGLGGFFPDARYDGGMPVIDGYKRGQYDNQWSYYFGGAVKTLPPQGVAGKPEWDAAWIFRNHVGNSLYYNPNTVYKPWVGLDVNLNPMFREYDPTTEDLPRMPWPNPQYTDTIDLLEEFDFEGHSDALYIPTYFRWTAKGEGDDGDGVIETTDPGVKVVIDKDISDSYPYINSDGLPDTRTYAEEIQNFANWFVYYRSREYATKAAIGKVINQTSAVRSGFDLFGIGRQDFADGSTVKAMSDTAAKREFLEKFYSTNSENSRNGTPARKALKRVGELFNEKTGSDPDDPEKDGTSPIVSLAKGGECQQNFNILLSDGFWNGRTSPNVGNADRDTSDVENNGFDGDIKESIDNGFYEDAHSNTLADVAMHYYETDLSPLPDKVNTTAGVDLATHQHLVTYSIAFGLEGLLDTNLDPADPTFPGWPDPASNTSHKIDDLWHAAYNGRGEYLSANNSEELTASLSKIITNFSKRIGTAAAVAINSARLSTESVVYLARFDSSSWLGNLLAFPIDPANGTLATQPSWDASQVLTALPSTSREILTYDRAPVAGAAKGGVAFQWNDVSADMQADLSTDPSGVSDGLGAKRLEYIRGGRLDEGANGEGFRERIALLGDIVNSGPVFVGEPALPWPDEAPFPNTADSQIPYSAFKNGSAKYRQKIVYVGANDGMLHALDEGTYDSGTGAFAKGTGKEVFAYVPEMVSSTNLDEGLHYLSDPNYAHNFYVDLSPSLSDIYFSNAWHTVLVGGMRSGGRGYFALDVTKPSSITEATAKNAVLWEFTHKDDPDLGYSYSRPFIGLTNAGTWVAIFGNGYNDTGAGEAQLFIVDIARGVGGNWVAGDNYRKITTKAGDPTTPNGLATPALADIDGNGTIDRVYAGDLKGNMWAFDMSSDDESLWKVAYGTFASPLPLFKTNGEPITAKPVLARHLTQPDSTSPSNAPNLMVYFGSGQYLVDADKSSQNQQSFYGVWDSNSGGLGRSNLQVQTFDTNFAQRVLTRNAIDYSTKKGWYFDFPNLGDEKGERAVTAAVARGDVVFFNSFIPSDDPCNSGGSGYRFAVDMTTGGSPLEATIDSDGSGKIDGGDKIVSSTTGGESTVVAVSQEGFLPEPVFIDDLAFTAEDAIRVKELPEPPSGRFSWQELIN